MTTFEAFLLWLFVVALIAKFHSYGPEAEEVGAFA
jgi:hypothetical protein